MKLSSFSRMAAKRAPHLGQVMDFLPNLWPQISIPEHTVRFLRLSHPVLRINAAGDPAAAGRAIQGGIVKFLVTGGTFKPIPIILVRVTDPVGDFLFHTSSPSFRSSNPYLTAFLPLGIVCLGFQSFFLLDGGQSKACFL
jgi:hypothetical protein